MRWASKWWGITLIAENKEDEKFLKELQSKLPKTPGKFESYENGEMEKGTNEKGEFYLEFNR